MPAHTHPLPPPPLIHLSGFMSAPLVEDRHKSRLSVASAVGNTTTTRYKKLAADTAGPLWNRDPRRVLPASLPRCSCDTMAVKKATDASVAGFSFPEVVCRYKTLTPANGGG